MTFHAPLLTPETGLYLILALPVVWALLALFCRSKREG